MFSKFTMKEILDMTSLGKTQWGFIFYNDGTVRQSVDMNDRMVVVEKYWENEWRCMSSYSVGPGPCTREDEITYGN